MIGINLSGAEFGRIGGRYGYDYIYPSASDLNYYADRGVELVRLPVLWERLQPAANGALDAAELGRLVQFLTDAQAAHVKVIVDLHNFGTYHGAVLGTSSLPDSQFADFWKKLASAIGTQPALAGYDIMNEPHDLPTGVWPAAAQAAVDAIRTVDTTHSIYVEGEAWANAMNWSQINANLDIKDPVNKIVYEAHLYFDRYTSGTYQGTYDSEGAYENIGVDRLQDFIAWLAEKNAKGFIGEFAVPKDDPRWLDVLDKFLIEMRRAGLDGTYWGAGPWWGSYSLALRNGEGAANPQLAVLERHIAAAAAEQGQANPQPDVNHMIGTDADESLTGTAGADWIEGSAGNDRLTGGHGDDRLDGGVGNDSLSGGVGNDYLMGGAGNDILDGGVGADRMEGGDGDDTYYVDSASDLVRELAGQGVDTVITSLDTYTVPDDVENITLGATGGITVTGNGSDNRIAGNDLANHIIAAGGNDNVTGGGGNDWIEGGSGADVLSGGAGDDRLFGGDGNDQLDGGTGLDYMVGGAGDDYYVIDNAGDVVVELAGEGIDTIVNSLDTFVMPDNTDWMYLVGSGGATATGNAQANRVWGNNIGNHILTLGGDDIVDAAGGDDWVEGGDGSDTLYGRDGNDRLEGGNGVDALYGGAGDDILDGGAGADRLEGGTGNDTYNVDNAGDWVIEQAGEGTDTVIISLGTYVMPNNVEYLRMGTTGGTTVTGTAGDNVMWANDLSNHILAGAGNDLIEAAGGDDWIEGGIGDDKLLGRTGNDRLEGGDGADTLWGHDGNDMLLGGTGDDVLYGDVGIDQLYGSDGNDTLDGGAGADRLEGGAGNDTYYVDNIADIVIEAAGGGTDTIVTTLDSYVLPTNFEYLRVLGDIGGLTMTLNAGDNVAWGNNLANHVLAGAGNDLVEAGAGDDWVEGGTGDDKLLGRAGNDRLQGGDGNDVLWGHDGADVLDGGIGNDIFEGGVGADRLTGGAGNDVFRITALGDSNAVGGRDTITDFAQGQDIIDLAMIDARVSTAGDQAFTLIGTGAFTRAEGQLRYQLDYAADGHAFTTVEGDVNGDGVADFSLVVDNFNTALAARDFML